MWLTILEKLVDFIERRQTLKQEQRERVANVFSDISKLLYEVADDLQEGIYPLGTCFTMTRLSEELLDHMREVVPAETIQELGPVLYNAARLEREYANRQDPATIDELRLAAGQFHVKAIIFKI